MLDDKMRNESPSLDYCVKRLRCGLDTFAQFIELLIETKQNDTVIMLLATT